MKKSTWKGFRLDLFGSHRDTIVAFRWKVTIKFDLFACQPRIVPLTVIIYRVHEINLVEEKMAAAGWEQVPRSTENVTLSLSSVDS